MIVPSAFLQPRDTDQRLPTSSCAHPQPPSPVAWAYPDAPSTTGSAGNAAPCGMGSRGDDAHRPAPAAERRRGSRSIPSRRGCDRCRPPRPISLKAALGFSTDFTDFTDGTAPDSLLDPAERLTREMNPTSCSTLWKSVQSV
jgi:hypothetical protein